MFEYLWIIVLAVACSTYVFLLKQAIEEGIKKGDINSFIDFIDIRDYLYLEHEGLLIITEVILLLLGAGLIILSIASAARFFGGDI